ncbi:hypothetical protein GGI35DRAFT_449502 [Trichoderma velutinum]
MPRHRKHKDGGAVDSFLPFACADTAYEHTYCSAPHPPFAFAFTSAQHSYSTGLIHAKPAQCYYCSHCWMRDLGPDTHPSMLRASIGRHPPASCSAMLDNQCPYRITHYFLTSRRTNHRHVECRPRVSTVRALASHLLHLVMPRAIELSWARDFFRATSLMHGAQAASRIGKKRSSGGCTSTRTYNCAMPPTTSRQFPLSGHPSRSLIHAESNRAKGSISRTELRTYQQSYPCQRQTLAFWPPCQQLCVIVYMHSNLHVCTHMQLSTQKIAPRRHEWLP